ncbi:MAG: redoxin domain-containing protein [Verrucomicrobia bacterium]|nr:redoxin domain-containing protein [Verrucomicrobiota bacterium]
MRFTPQRQWTTALSVVFLNSLSAFAQSPPEPADVNEGRNFVQERAELEASWEMLSLKWGNLSIPRKPPTTLLKSTKAKALSLLELRKTENDANLPAPQRRSLAITTLNGFRDPGEIRSNDTETTTRYLKDLETSAPKETTPSKPPGTLTAVLTATYARNYIGNDPVYLRGYNGQLVGPTLRAKPGDVMRITVRNDLPTQAWQANSMNKLHAFNTTNLHTHGLHVSPNGISDNVLIQILPGATQEYVIEIPKDHVCGTFWYHPHNHGSTAANVASGMSGALIIEGGLDDLPEIRAAKERVMVLNQILYVNKVPAPDKTKPDIILPEGVIEEKYAGLNLGPRDAETLGRFTTINGVQLPIIRMRPGQLERWRLIDSAQSEIIAFQLVAVDDPAKIVPLYEIAVDGLPLGKSVKKETIQMFPGYRSDVLVQIAKPGEYLIVDQAKLGMKSDQIPLQYIARVVVEGEPVTGMKMPTDAQMKPFRLKTLVDEKPVTHQKAVYDIHLVTDKDDKPTGVRFWIDQKSFSEDEARVLELGTVDEWKVSVRNSVNPDSKNLPINTGHPFHIHVNPFEITSIMAPEDPTKPDSKPKEYLTDGPVWRDTIWMPNNGTVTFKTKYEDFIGTFVQHCHILDHEDQGMMELIDIQEKAPATAAVKKPHPAPAKGAQAPDFSLPDAAGQLHALTDQLGQRQIVFLFKGHGCLHCAQQVQEFTSLYEKFKAKGIQIIGITSDPADVLKTALAEAPCPFPILADPTGKAFAAYGCLHSNELAHGTFLLDAKGRVQWRITGPNPYLAVSQLLEIPLQTTAINEQKP